NSGSTSGYQHGSAEWSEDSRDVRHRRRHVPGVGSCRRASRYQARPARSPLGVASNTEPSPTVQPAHEPGHSAQDTQPAAQERGHGPQNAQQAAAQPQQPAPDPNEPKDAAAFSRRGAASAARRDFVHAIADLTRACELDPNEPSYFYERGQAYL